MATKHGNRFMFLGFAVVLLLVGALAVGVALAANGAQHGYTDLQVADIDGNTGPYLVNESNELWTWENQQGEWSERHRTCTALFTSGASKGQCKTFTDFTAYAATGNTTPPNTVGTPCSPLAAGDCNVTTGSGIDTVKTQYHWFWTCGNYVLVSSDATTYDITLYVNGTGAMESWQSSRNYPLPLGKFSFSISSLERVAAASWSVTKNGDPFASGDLLGNLALDGPDNYPFDAAHEGSGPDHGAGLYMNDILALDSWAKNDTSGGNRVRIIDPPSFTLDTDAAADYEVTLTFTIKDGETGTVVTKSATTNIAVQYEPAEPPLPLCTT